MKYEPLHNSIKLLGWQKGDGYGTFLVFQHRCTMFIKFCDAFANGKDVTLLCYVLE